MLSTGIRLKILFIKNTALSVYFNNWVEAINVVNLGVFRGQ